MTDLLRRLVREPLLHFLVLGGVLFALLGRGDPAVEGSDIVVSKDDIARIAAGFASTWRRPPSADELNAVVADDIREQVLYRAGLALGLDKEDTIVRRRIRQKMEFFLEGTVEAPKENDLETFLAANPDKFRTEPQVAFRQVFVSAKREGAQAEAEALLPQLVSAGSGPSSFGDATLLPAAVDLAPLSAIAAQFGVGFAKDMTNPKPGTWTGPIASAYGYHLVLVTRAEPARLPALGEVRPAVEREWFAERRKEVLAARYGELKARYAVRFEGGVSAQ
jgi:PPIC-type PPIASE domain